MLDRNEIIRIYGLANLKLKEEEIDKITEKYAKVLTFAEEILAVDTQGIPETEMVTEKVAQLREDEVKPSVSREDALKNAEDTEYGYFRLERVLD